MLYLTQLIFIKAGQEAKFHEFEDFAIPLMEKYNGRIEYRVRPKAGDYIDLEGEAPYEIHFISFDSETDFQNFMKDDSRKAFKHLKEASVESSILIKGEKL